MKLKDAIEKVLRESRGPLGADVIAAKVLSKGLWQTNGKTPAATVAAQLYRSIKEGERRFIKVGKGMFGLNGVKYGATGKGCVVPRNAKESCVSGYVYILTNPSMKGMVKIGKTKRPVNVRSKDLYTSAVPTPPEEYISLKTSKYEQVEDLMHRILTKLTRSRVNMRREFFKMKPQDALEVLKDVSIVLDPDDRCFCRHGEEVLAEPIIAAPKGMCKVARKVKVPSAKGLNRWDNKTQLAKLLALRGGRLGSKGHIFLTLSGKRRCPVDGRWRKLLEDAGVTFNKNDFVKDWKHAKNPM